METKVIRVDVTSTIDVEKIILASRQRKSRDGFTMKEIAKPAPNDVVCGRGGGSQNHVGNKEYRAVIAANKRRYIEASRRYKSLLVESIVQAVRAQDPPGRFLEKDTKTGLWNDIGDKRAFAKTCQAIREGAPRIREEMRVEQNGGSVGVGVPPVTLSAPVTGDRSNVIQDVFMTPSIPPRIKVTEPPSVPTTAAATISVQKNVNKAIPEIESSSNNEKVAPVSTAAAASMQKNVYNVAPKTLKSCNDAKGVPTSTAKPTDRRSSNIMNTPFQWVSEIFAGSNGNSNANKSNVNAEEKEFSVVTPLNLSGHSDNDPSPGDFDPEMISGMILDESAIMNDPMDDFQSSLDLLDTAMHGCVTTFEGHSFPDDLDVGVHDYLRPLPYEHDVNDVDLDVKGELDDFEDFLGNFADDHSQEGELEILKRRRICDDNSMICD